MNAPGSLLRAFAASLFVDGTLARVVDPAVADLEAEWRAARERGAGAAFRVRIAGTAALAVTIGLALIVRPGSKIRALPWTFVGPAFLAASGGSFLLRAAGHPAHGSLQALWLSVAAVVLALCAFAPARRLLERPRWFAGLAAFAVLAGAAFAVPVPAPISPTVVAPFGFPLQPGELAKPFFLLAMAGWLAAPGRAPARWLSCAALTLLCVASAVARADAGSAAVVLATAAAMVVARFGTGRASLAWLSGSALAIFGLVLRARDSLSSFDAAVPASHTDGVLATAFGFGGARGVLLMALPVALVVASVFARVVGASRATRVVASGVGAAFAAQAFLHVAALLSFLPNTGLPLPLVSYGGSSLVSHFALLGLVAAALFEARSSVERLA